jgi:hypothetical protein
MDNFTELAIMIFFNKILRRFLVFIFFFFLYNEVIPNFVSERGIVPLHHMVQSYG